MVLSTSSYESGRLELEALGLTHNMLELISGCLACKRPLPGKKIIRLVKYSGHETVVWSDRILPSEHYSGWMSIEGENMLRHLK